MKQKYVGIVLICVVLVILALVYLNSLTSQSSSGIPTWYWTGTIEPDVISNDSLILADAYFNGTFVGGGYEKPTNVSFEFPKTTGGLPNITLVVYQLKCPSEYELIENECVPLNKTENCGTVDNRTICGLAPNENPSINLVTRGLVKLNLCGVVPATQTECKGGEIEYGFDNRKACCFNWDSPSLLPSIPT